MRPSLAVGMGLCALAALLALPAKLPPLPSLGKPPELLEALWLGLAGIGCLLLIRPGAKPAWRLWCGQGLFAALLLSALVAAAQRWAAPGLAEGGNWMVPAQISD